MEVTEEENQFVVDELDELLARRHGREHVRVQRLFLDAVGELAGNLVVDVGIEERAADLPHRLRDVEIGDLEVIGGVPDGYGSTDRDDQENQQQAGEEQHPDEGEKQEQEESEEGEENDENPEDKQPTTAEKLEEMNISEEKARMILEAMKNKEIQYKQQNKRKAKKPKKSGKPDW